MNDFIQIRSAILVAIIWLGPSKFLAQQKIDVKEGAFLNSIDWYIKGSLDSINTHPVYKNVTALKQLGLMIAVQFYNNYDTITQKIDSAEYHLIINKRNRFRVTLDGNQFEDDAPSFYFIRHGTPVVIFTGTEGLIYPSHQAFKRLEKDVNTRNTVLIQLGNDGHSLPDYWIELGEEFKEGFKATRVVYHKLK